MRFLADGRLPDLDGRDLFHWAVERTRTRYGEPLFAD